MWGFSLEGKVATREKRRQRWSSLSIPLLTKILFRCECSGRDLKRGNAKITPNCSTVRSEWRERGNEKKRKEMKEKTCWLERRGGTMLGCVAPSVGGGSKSCSRTKVTDSDDGNAIELIKNHHYCGGEDGFSFSCWWYEDIHIYYKEIIMTCLHEIALLQLIRLMGQLLCALRGSIHRE